MAEKYPLEFDQITDVLKNFGQSHVIRVKARETSTMYIVERESGEVRFPKLAEQAENGQVSEAPKSKGFSIKTHVPRLYVVDSQYAKEVMEKNHLAKISENVELAVRKMIQNDRFDPRIKEIAKIMGLLDGDSKNE